MENWVTVKKTFSTAEEARRVAEILKITESRLSSVPRGPQYDIETEVSRADDGWQVRWRKVLAGYDSGCSGCGSCNNKSNPGKQSVGQGKVIEFKPKQE
ncbi:MAG: hypothetical protein M1609_01415 [Firmicutes bacterium]|nr:hypothetical protein [Bacillota bacterium]